MNYEVVETMEISPNFTCEEWKELDLSDSNSNDWEKAISCLESRIKERYIKPVDILIEHEEAKKYSERRFGFTILAIDCLLVETLQAFKDGNKETRSKQGKTVFVKFLNNSKNLGKYFNEENKFAEKFYKNYRNGILHQAQIKNNHLVWSIGKVVFEQSGAMVINRTAFHKCLKDDFELYLQELRNNSNSVIRNNFKKKMDSLCL